MGSTEWKPTKEDNPEYKCPTCQSNDVWYRVWESTCGGYEDYRYRCKECGREWWVESADA